ncbi:MAG TPA: YicC/YloC family endoribonuclease [Gemmatimonadales bacterium]|nr:YicC/YloC family endoribonuclease [Gemmatimonadales bacterium]
MTGFGAAEGAVGGGRLRIEIRSVNHRHLSVQLKVPGELADCEGALRERLRAHFQRGHVTVSGHWLEAPPQSETVEVDAVRARALVKALRALGKELKIAGALDLAALARLPDVVRVTRGDGAPDTTGVLAALDRAAQACVAAREQEGRALAADLRGRIDLLAALGRRVSAAAPARLVRESERLAASVKTLSGGVTIEPDRLAKEIAILADRLDITEELVRFTTHLDAMRQALDGTDEAVGRRLGFLLQEAGREVNTMGSKANDAAIAEAVITMKTELEKLREQVENLE